jgi:hypothetical protein
MGYLQRRKVLPAELVLRTLSSLPAVEQLACDGLPPLRALNLANGADFAPLYDASEANFLVTVLK